MANRTSVWATLACAGVLIAGCGGGATAPAAPEASQTAERPVVVAATVAPATADGLIRATGTVAYERETTLAFKTGGVVAQVRVDEGDVVKPGQRLAQLDLTELAAGLTQADAAVANAEAQYARTQSLFEKGHVAKARLDDAALVRDQARANRDAVSFNREQGVIESGSGGVVLRRFADPGQTVAPGAPILLIGDAKSGLVLRVPVSAAEAASLRVGDTSEVSIDGLADNKLAGKVIRIAAKSDEATGNFEVDLSFDEKVPLRSGLVGDAVIKASAAGPASNTALRIPSLALLDARADQGYVYVIDDKDIARRRAISTSGIQQGDVVVVSGLAAGERIVAEGAAYVRDGEAVTVSELR